MSNFNEIYNNIINEGSARRRTMTLTDLQKNAAKIIGRGVDREQAGEVIKAIQDLIDEAHNLGYNKAMSPGSGGVSQGGTPYPGIR